MGKVAAIQSLAPPYCLFLHPGSFWELNVSTETDWSTEFKHKSQSGQARIRQPLRWPWPPGPQDFDLCRPSLAAAVDLSSPAWGLIWRQYSGGLTIWMDDSRYCLGRRTFWFLLSRPCQSLPAAWIALVPRCSKGSLGFLGPASIPLSLPGPGQLDFPPDSDDPNPHEYSGEKIMEGSGWVVATSLSRR